jgi:6-phosphogluconolactonase (cycloisomerase 2 family)
MMHPRGNFAYLYGYDNTIAAYGVDSATGKLGKIGSFAAVGGNSVSYFNIDPSGKFAYTYSPVVCVNSCRGVISIFGIEDTGKLTLVSSFEVADFSLIAINPKGGFVYINAGNSILTYRIQYDGNLVLAGSTDVNYHAQRITFDPNGRFAYITGCAICYSLNSSVYRIESNGVLTAVNDSDFISSVFSSSIVFDSSGIFAYRADGGIFGYNVDNLTGKLNPMAGSPFVSQGRSSTAVLVSENGGFAYELAGNGLSVYGIDGSTGVLNPIQGSPFGAGAYNFISPDPSGKFVFVGAGNPYNDGFRAFRIENTGALTQIFSASGMTFNGGIFFK